MIFSFQSQFLGLVFEESQKKYLVGNSPQSWHVSFLGSPARRVEPPAFQPLYKTALGAGGSLSLCLVGRNTTTSTIVTFQ